MKKLKALWYFLLLMLPTVIWTMLLIKLFLYTGLGRILTVPATFIVNIIIVVASMFFLYKKNWKNNVKIILVVCATSCITIAFYPQESGPHVTTQVKNAIHAITHIDRITKNDLNKIDYTDDSKYIVALYKFRNEIPLDGTYYLYNRDYDYTGTYIIHNLENIPSKLETYHKVIWWYLVHFVK